MENLAKILSQYLLSKNIITEDMIDVYNYGFQCFLELFANVLCSIAIGLYLKMLPECLYFFLFFIPLRSFGGGFHLNTYLKCFLASCIVLISSLLIVKYIELPIIISAIIYIVFAILLLFIGPVNHPNKIVTADKNRVFISRTYITILISFFLFLFFIITENKEYLLLQAIVFLIVFASSLIGRLVNQEMQTS
ncbi:MAG: accessory gene regulator B family protein [Lachnospiraceae bacterium]|nr:accessory gene regulator B family protein [Lachnospiraceae bacterium]